MRKGRIVPLGYGDKKPKVCTACNGSGHYDHDGAPKCGACNGTGLERNELSLTRHQ